MTSLSILGCGWLGLPLAKVMAALGFCVKGSTTTQEKVPLLQEANIIPFLVKCDPLLEGKKISSFFDSQILFLNIPFRRHLEDPCFYKEQIASVISYIEKSNIEFVIFASSTSIYPSSIKEAFEDTLIVPDNPRARVLREAEEMLLKNKHFSTTVIRFAGLYGGQRKIGQFLSGKKSLGQGGRFVNLIHLDDCVEIIVEILKKDIRGEIFNACSDGHPSRKELYTRAAELLDLESPQFIEQEPEVSKIVSNKKLKKYMNYKFKYPDPLGYLEGLL